MERLLNEVFKAIASAFNTTVDMETEPPKYNSYPYPTAWKGHNDAISYILRNKESFLMYPTGSGKTVIYIVSAVESDLKTLVIVPRNGLQEQVAEYGDKVGVPILYLFERSKMCNKKQDGKRTPCSRKFRKNGKWYFKLGDEVVEFPCKDCPYEVRKGTIRELFRENKCIAVMNQGNFWFLRSQAEFIIIDEADETLRSITDAVSYSKQYSSDDPLEVLEWMRDCISEDLGKVMKALETTRNENELEKLNNLLQRLERKARKIEFFMDYPSEKLITYIKGSKTFVEVFDSPINVVRRLFPDAKICLVTATPPINDGTGSRTDFKIPFRARVVYAPLGNMSERNVFRKGNTELLDEAAEFIIKTYDYTVTLTGMKKAPIHCGNLGKHGLRIYEILKANGRKAVLMEAGNQINSIKEFIQSDADFFCAVAIEYGFDWGFSPIQYVLKVPFADLGDPRLKAIKKLLGKDKFNEWYNWDALSRLIQACGRNARRPDDFGVTIILDSCFERLYKRFESKIPQWFKDRLIWLEGGQNGESR